MGGLEHEIVASERCRRRGLRRSAKVRCGREFELDRRPPQKRRDFSARESRRRVGRALKREIELGPAASRARMPSRTLRRALYCGDF